SLPPRSLSFSSPRPPRELPSSPTRRSSDLADCGRVVNDPHDARELAGAIAELADPARLPVYKAAAAEAGRRWTFEDHYRQLLTVLEEVAARKRAAAVAA